MESLATKVDFMTRMTYIYLIMPFYDYAYGSAKIIRGLCQQSRHIWMTEQDAIIRMLKKQTIHFDWQQIDEKTIRSLKRGYRYK